MRGRRAVVFDLISALLAAVAVAVAPGWFWAGFLSDRADRAERLAFSVALSMGMVSALALALSSLFGSGVTLAVAIASILAVFLSGLAAHLFFGRAKASEEPLAGHAAEPPPDRVEGRRVRNLARRLALPAVMAVVAVRGYLGPVLHDWPYIRGIDQYIQSVMVNLALSGGEIKDFMVYPAGFHAFLASVSRLSGLEPLELFPVLGPAFLLLPPLALYALGRRIWGVPVGVAAAFFSGVVLASSHQYLIEARYLHLTAAQFFMALAVAALLGLLAAPSFRSGALFAAVGSSIVLFHPVSSFYLALLLALLAAFFLPYLLIRERRTAIALFSSLAALGLLAVAFAWDSYDLGRFALNLLGGSSGPTSAAVTGAVGTQQPYDLSHLPGTISHPVLWLGLLGAALLFAEGKKPSLPYALAKAALLVWALLMFIGSRTATSGFPERFERDLGVPLALLAAFAAVSVLGFAANAERRASLRLLAAAAVVAVVGWQAFSNLHEAAAPAPEDPTATDRIAMTPEFEAAGAWLEENNGGGNIIAEPYLASLPSRAILAMGRYSSVQTFTDGRIDMNRDLPPSGQKPPRDALSVIRNPDSERAREIVEGYDIRYIVLYKRNPGWEWRGVRYPDLYQKTFENNSVVIFDPSEARRGDSAESAMSPAAPALDQASPSYG
ncbi:MAG: hypothetical protein ACR2N0_12160 [Rubrobacteraceae bacterium]